MIMIKKITKYNNVLKINTPNKLLGILLLLLVLTKL